MSRVPIRNKQEIELLQKSGEISAKVLKKVLSSVKEGTTLAQLDKIAEEEVIRLGGAPSFKTVPGYYWTTCLTVNDEVVHGIPRPLKLKKGDVLSVDLGVFAPRGDGWFTDVAWTVVIGGEVSKETKRFLQVGERTLWQAISQAVEGNKIGDISATIQAGVEKAGFSVVTTLTGHGVGRAVHEPPEIPGFGTKGTGLELKEGMCLAIEVIYTAGNGDVYHLDDGWTIASSDKSLGGLFEMTVVVGNKKPKVLTDWQSV